MTVNLDLILLMTTGHSTCLNKAIRSATCCKSIIQISPKPPTVTVTIGSVVRIFAHFSFLHFSFSLVTWNIFFAAFYVQLLRYILPIVTSEHAALPSSSCQSFTAISPVISPFLLFSTHHLLILHSLCFCSIRHRKFACLIYIAIWYVIALHTSFTSIFFETYSVISIAM